MLIYNYDFDIPITYSPDTYNIFKYIKTWVRIGQSIITCVTYINISVHDYDQCNKALYKFGMEVAEAAMETHISMIQSKHSLLTLTC